jgi:hypothetical protein
MWFVILRIDVRAARGGSRRSFGASTFERNPWVASEDSHGADFAADSAELQTLPREDAHVHRRRDQERATGAVTEDVLLPPAEMLTDGVDETMATGVEELPVA